MERYKLEITIDDIEYSNDREYLNDVLGDLIDPNYFVRNNSIISRNRIDLIAEYEPSYVVEMYVLVVKKEIEFLKEADDGIVIDFKIKRIKKK